MSLEDNAHPSLSHIWSVARQHWWHEPLKSCSPQGSDFKATDNCILKRFATISVTICVFVKAHNGCSKRAQHLLFQWLLHQWLWKICNKECCQSKLHTWILHCRLWNWDILLENHKNCLAKQGATSFVCLGKWKAQNREFHHIWNLHATCNVQCAGLPTYHFLSSHSSLQKQSVCEMQLPCIFVFNNGTDNNFHSAHVTLQGCCVARSKSFRMEMRQFVKIFFGMYSYWFVLWWCVDFVFRILPCFTAKRFRLFGFYGAIYCLHYIRNCTSHFHSSTFVTLVLIRILSIHWPTSCCFWSFGIVTKRKGFPEVATYVPRRHQGPKEPAGASSPAWTRRNLCCWWWQQSNRVRRKD